jgi:hypothetical protein
MFPTWFRNILLYNFRIALNFHDIHMDVTETHCMRFEIAMAVKLSMLVFWVVMPRVLVGRYQRFGGTYFLHLQDIIAQKININKS